MLEWLSMAKDKVVIHDNKPIQLGIFQLMNHGLTQEQQFFCREKEVITIKYIKQLQPKKEN